MTLCNFIWPVVACRFVYTSAWTTQRNRLQFCCCFLTRLVTGHCDTFVLLLFGLDLTSMTRPRQMDSSRRRPVTPSCASISLTSSSPPSSRVCHHRLCKSLVTPSFTNVYSQIEWAYIIFVFMFKMIAYVILLMYV